MARALGPAGAWWLKSRVQGRFPILFGHVVREARDDSGKARLSVTRPDGHQQEFYAGHIIAATGYRVDVSALQFLDSRLSIRIRREGAAPALSSDFESSIPGLYFTGLASTNRFGPAMRFLCGAEYSARTIARSLRPARTNSSRNQVGLAEHISGDNLAR